MKRSALVHPEALSLLSVLMDQLRRPEGQWDQAQCKELSHQVAELWFFWCRLGLPNEALFSLHQAFQKPNEGVPLLPEEKDQVLAESLKQIRKAPMEGGKPIPAQSLRFLRRLAGFGLLAFALSFLLNMYWIYSYQNQDSRLGYFSSNETQEARYQALFARYFALENQAMQLLQPGTQYQSLQDSTGWKLHMVWIPSDMGLLVHVDTFPADGKTYLLQSLSENLGTYVTVDTLSQEKAESLLYFVPLSKTPDTLIISQMP